MDQPKKIKIKALRIPENTLGTVNPQASKNAYKADFYGNNERDGVDFPALLQLINKVNTNPKCIFKWNDFERQPTIRTYDTRDGEGGTIQRMKITANNIPFTYKNEFGQTIETQLQAKLNKRIDFIDSQWSFKIDIDGKKNKIFAQLSLYYVNTEKFRKEVESTANPNDFNINDKYRAIIFQTENLTDFAHLVKEIDADSNYSYYIKDKITEKMVAALKATKDKEEIVFLFENAPSWIAENFKSEELITFLELILSYDVDGFWSGYVDGSSAFINVLRGFNTQEKCVDLYTFFKNNPTKLKEIYHALDGTSVWEGTQMANKTIFASFLVSLCYANYDQLEFASKTFFIGDGYKVNTSAIGALDFNKTKYFLKQERTKLITMIPLANFAYYPLTYDEDLEKGSEYNPLEMIIVYDYDQKQPPSKSKTKTAPIPMIVPAIFLHDMASREELAEIVKVVRIGVNIFVIALSVASFGSASPLVALMLAVDITLATTDTIIALAEDHLSQEFLETWSKIYLIGGAVAATPLLLDKIFTIGIKVLNGTVKAEFKNFVRAFIFKIIIEKNIANFTKNTIKEILFVEETIISKGVRIEFANITRLQKAGTTFIKGIDFDGKVKGYAVIYKGEDIASGTAKEIKETLKNAWKASGSKLIEVLDKLPITRKFKDVTYKIVREENYIEWIMKESNLKNKARLFSGMLEFDLNTLGAAKGLGQKFTSEAFEFFKDNIKSVKAEWQLNPKYPGGSSLGYKEYTKALLELGNKTEAVKKTTFYRTMSLYQFDKVDDVLDYSSTGGNIIILLKK
ncbi:MULTISPECIES: hypothetical protein [Flavobacterium]|uniref:Uncharacterized protein n=1 Tax=Flavobacterium jumunjinense TaxID=998845 RepID=A0ABV5GNP5_9FLAO|nr:MULTISPECIES: hypothetical protein [Flavobacterium]